MKDSEWRNLHQGGTYNLTTTTKVKIGDVCKNMLEDQRHYALIR